MNIRTHILIALSTALAFLTTVALYAAGADAPHRVRPANRHPFVQALPHKIEGNLKKSDTKNIQDASGFDLWIGSDSIDEWRVPDRGCSL